MADRSIGELPLAPQVADNSLLAVEQGGVAHRMTGAQFKEFAKSSVRTYVESAITSAESAEASAKSAKADAEASATSAAEAAESERSAKEYSGNPPIIQDSRWWTWDASQQKYVDTGKTSKGNIMYATFYVDVASGELWMFYDEEYTGPTFNLVDSNLEVILTYGN